MKVELTEEEQKYLDDFLKPYIEDDKVQEMKQYIQHGTITTYEHCYQVARGCLYANRRWKFGADEEVMLRAAMLHDFYLYDWHNSDGGSHDWHGYIHAERARLNALKHFHIGKHEQHIIYSHMWPLNITRLPRSREAWIVCLVDKYVSTCETLFDRKKRSDLGDLENVN